jgi:hypothetical protein
MTNGNQSLKNIMTKTTLGELLILAMTGFDQPSALRSSFHSRFSQNRGLSLMSSCYTWLEKSGKSGNNMCFE